MSYNYDISSCFGITDHIFATHAIETKQAKKIIKELKFIGYSFEDFKKEIVWYLYQKVCMQNLVITGKEPNLWLNHIESQIEKAQKFWVAC